MKIEIMIAVLGIICIGALAAVFVLWAKLDELILSIVGPELFVPFDQIYGAAYIDEAKRIRVRMKEVEN